MKKESETRDNAYSSIIEMAENISKLNTACMRAECINVGMHPGYRQIISYLLKEDGAPQLELVRLTNFKPSTISVTLQKMEQEGYVTRKTDLFDQRSVRVYLTDKAKDMEKTLVIRSKEKEEEAAANFTTDELKKCCEIMERVYDSMRGKI